MKAIKIICVLLLLLVLSLLAFGCAESFTYTEYIDSDGAVHREYLLVYDKEAEDAAEVKAQAVHAMQNFVAAKGVAEYATITDTVEGEVLLHLTFPSITDYYVALGLTGREENTPIEATEKGFIERYDMEIDSYLTDNVIEYVRELVSEEYADFPLACDFYYTYGTVYRTVKSNSDEVKKQDGIYYHTWKLEYGKPANMVITSHYPNGVILICITISVFVLSLIVIFAIIFINKKKNMRLIAAAEDALPTEDGATPPQE